MLKIFGGTERAKAELAVKKVLGDDYETIEADNLSLQDMASVFLGTSLFGEERRILLKGLDENRECWRELPRYVDTPHRVVIWNEKTPDRRSEPGKSLAANSTVEIRSFDREISKDEKYAAFNVYDDAMRGRLKKALASCDEMAQDKTKDPYATLGALTSKAFTALERRERRAPAVLKILAKTDTEMKSTGLDAWVLVKKALVEMSMLK